MNRLGRKLGLAAARRARPRVRAASRTLARAIEIQRPTIQTTWVVIPHYWAIMVHEGRRPFSKPFLMAWFRDPRNDPRLSGGQTPRRVSQLKHLTRQEFLFWMQMNRQADPTGLNPRARPMIVTKVIRKGTPPNRFFDNRDGMRGFGREASGIIQAEFSKHVAAVVPGVGRELVAPAAVLRL